MFLSKVQSAIRTNDLPAIRDAINSSPGGCYLDLAKADTSAEVASYLFEMSNLFTEKTMAVACSLKDPAAASELAQKLRARGVAVSDSALNACIRMKNIALFDILMQEKLTPSNVGPRLARAKEYERLESLLSQNRVQLTYGLLTHPLRQETRAAIARSLDKEMQKEPFYRQGVTLQKIEEIIDYLIELSKEDLEENPVTGGTLEALLTGDTRPISQIDPFIENIPKLVFSLLIADSTIPLRERVLLHFPPLSNQASWGFSESAYQ